jgi:addiction module HigA family antidote
MLMTKRKPASVGEFLVREIMRPMGLTQATLGPRRGHVDASCENRRDVTAVTALILARVFDNSVDFWLNAQRRGDPWRVINSERERIARAKPLRAAA